MKTISLFLQNGYMFRPTIGQHQAYENLYEKASFTTTISIPWRCYFTIHLLLLVWEPYEH